MFVKILVFGGQVSVNDIARQGVKPDGSAALVGEDFIEQLAAAVQQFGGSGGGMGSEAGGIGQIPEKIKKQETRNKKQGKKYYLFFVDTRF